MGAFGTVKFTGLENAEGGDGNDLFRLNGNINNAVVRLGDNTNGFDTLEVERDADMRLSENTTFQISDTLDVQSVSPQSYQVMGIDALVLTGGESANEISALPFRGPTTIQGRGGNDRLYGGYGDDTIGGGDGDDLIYGGYSLGRDTIFGEAGNDILMGGSGIDLLYGGAGQDLITGSFFLSLLPYATEGARDAILAAWFSTESYADRIRRLTITGVGPNQATKLLPLTEALDDFERDTVFGDADLDWYFLNTAGINKELGASSGGMRDLEASEIVVSL